MDDGKIDGKSVTGTGRMNDSSEFYERLIERVLQVCCGFCPSWATIELPQAYILCSITEILLQTYGNV